MRPNEIGELISRFLPFFDPVEDGQRGRGGLEDETVPSSSPHLGLGDPARIDTVDPIAFQARPGSPLLHGESAAAKVGQPEARIDPRQGLTAETPSVEPSLDIPGPFGGSDRSSLFDLLFGRPGTGETPPEPESGEEDRPEAIYRPAIKSSAGFLRQDTLLDDRDTFHMSEPDEALAARIEKAAAGIADLVHTASGWAAAGARPTSGEEIGSHVAARFADAPHLRGDEQPPALHDGYYVNGEVADAAPDIDLESRVGAVGREEQPEGTPAGFELQTGDNLLFNQAVVFQGDEGGATTVVVGDVYESNVIRQLNVYVDRDDFGALTAGPGGTIATSAGTEAYNVAHFERLDAGAPFRTAEFGLPSRYVVDVVEGDVVIGNFVHQVHTVLDGDSAVLSSAGSYARIDLGANAVLGSIDLAHLGGLYDLVVIGGDLYEQNVIEQINILFDNDRGAALPGVHPAGTIQSSANLLSNDAAILTYGEASFVALNEETGDLLQAFAARETAFDPALNEAFGLYGSGTLRILYVTGNRYEFTEIRQTNILADGDDVVLARSLRDGLLAAQGSEEGWHVDTGGNLLVNYARIVDVDATGDTRFLGGDAYSETVLVQAEFLGTEDGLRPAGTQLVPELVAFIDDGGESTDDGPQSYHLPYDAQGDGLAGLLA